MSVDQLIDHAGKALLTAVQEYLPTPARVSLFCGKGSNGADGYTLAKLLKEKHYHVECFSAFEEAELSPICRARMLAAREAGVDVYVPSDPKWKFKCDCVGCRDLVVDALVGTGSMGAVRDGIDECVACINRSGVPVISVDVPTGIHPDTGEELGNSVWAMRTVTFGLPKPYLVQGQGLEHSGYWTADTIGLPGSLLNEPTIAQLLELEWVGSMLPERLRASHKSENGHVLIVAGSDFMPGAAILAATAAYRAGAGLVTLASTPEVCRAMAVRMPEVLLMPLPTVGGILSGDAAHPLLANQGRFQSAVFGPGMTHNDSVSDLLGRVWEKWEIPSVIDADAINVASMGVPLPDVDCLLTPHPAELGRLLEMSVAEVQTDRFRSVQMAAEKTGKTVILKGPYSLLNEPGQPILVNTTGNSGMASAGMGDILSGVSGTLLAQSLPSYFAGACAMYWHGAAGDLCAEEIGAIGFTASDVTTALPRARARMVGSCLEPLH